MSVPMRKTSWSPIDCLPGAKLTESGLLELLPGEVLLWNRPDFVELRAAVPDDEMAALTFAGNLANTTGKTWVDRSLDCVLTITTHRLVFQQSNVSGEQINARFLHLANVIADAQLEKATLFKSARILLVTVLGELFVIFRGDKGSINSKDASQCIESALRRKEWQTEAKLLKMKQEEVALVSNKVGVEAILARSEARRKQAQTVTDQAFLGDAETLMQEAAALIKVIEKYVATLDKHENREDGSTEDSDRLAGMLQNMGMTAAFSKADYKGREDAYYAQLARQLADFLRPKLKNTMMTLTDVYCLFNRARGSNLISPEDLLCAVEHIEKLPLGLSHHKFPSGLRVLQDASLNQDKMEKIMIEIAKNGITEMEASHVLHVSALLAQQQLHEAERHGALVRDETTECIRFFPNRFHEWIEQ